MNRKIILDLRISAEEFQRMYAGEARTVFAYDIYGKSVRFPAGILQRFVTHDGIRGRFQIEFSADNKFKSIERLEWVI